MWLRNCVTKRLMHPRTYFLKKGCDEGLWWLWHATMQYNSARKGPICSSILIIISILYCHLIASTMKAGPCIFFFSLLCPQPTVNVHSEHSINNFQWIIIANVCWGLIPHMILGHLNILTHLIVTVTLWGEYCYHSHFADEKLDTEWLNCLRSHSNWWGKLSKTWWMIE